MSPPLTPSPGCLLVATPELQDPNFEGTVILLLEHGADGTLGVVLNRPSPLEVADAMTSDPDSVDPAEAGQTWEEIATDPAVVFVGGPVQPNAILALARVSEVLHEDAWEPIFDDVGVVRLSDGPLPAVGTVVGLRLFAGYAGWGEEQLAGELDQGAWFVVQALSEDGFSHDPATLWRTVLRRQGGLFTTVTDSPVLN